MGNLYLEKKAIFNLIKEHNDVDYSVIDKIHLYVKDPNETKHQYLIKKLENWGFENPKDPKAVIKYSNNIHGYTTKSIKNIKSTNQTENAIY